MSQFQDGDVQLTAYALGELSPDEAAAFEATLSDAQREQVASIRAAGDALRLALANESDPHHAPDAAAAAAGSARSSEPAASAAASPRSGVAGAIRPTSRWPALAAAAALVAGGLTAGLVIAERDGGRRDVAMETPEADRVLAAFTAAYAESQQALVAGDREAALAAQRRAADLAEQAPSLFNDAVATSLQQLVASNSAQLDQLDEPAAMAAPAEAPAAPRKTFEAERDAQRQLILFRFNEAVADAQTALAVNDLNAAERALQQARTAANTNPFIFAADQRSAFDAQINAVSTQISQRRQSAAQQQARQDQQTAEREARSREPAREREATSTVASLEADAKAAEAAGDAAAASDLRQQARTIDPASSSGSRPDPTMSVPPPAAAPARASQADFGGGRGRREALGLSSAPVGGAFFAERAPAETVDEQIGDAEAVIGEPVLGLEDRFAPPIDREAYDALVDNDFDRPIDAPLSTFSVDVDTASYANVRRMIQDGQMPPASAVRVEELVNYFDYDYPLPEGDDPFGCDIAVAEAPWAAGHQLVRIGLQAQGVDPETRPGANLVFLVDVSGSMNSPDKLPLVQRGLRELASRLDGRDSVAMVVYAGSSGVVLEPTNGGETEAIQAAIDRLSAGGSTNGAAGITTAYDLAKQAFREGGVNRVVLATDGDFNVGTTDTGSLVDLVEKRATEGVYLTVLGFGTGNLNDAMLEEISNRGDGTYAYVDSPREAETVLGERMLSTVQTVAKDVKVQVEFNPAAVESYRLIGYANRMLAAKDFNDDTKDAGDVGAGHQVTALYEVIPVAAGQGHFSGPAVDELKYQRPTTMPQGVDPTELATVKLRWKAPDAAKEQGTSELVAWPVKAGATPLAEAGDDFRLAASAAGFGMLLRDAEHKDALTWPGLVEMTAWLDGLDRARLTPEDARRQEFRDLVERAAQLAAARDE